MNTAALGMRILLAAVFAVAGVGKIVGALEFRKAVAAFGLPLRLVGAVSVGLPAFELAVAVLLLSARGAWWGAAAALGALIVFTGAVALNLAKGRQPDCRCFGQIQPTPIGPATIVRNVLLAGCAGLVLASETGRLNISVSSGLAQLSGVPPIVIVVGLAVLVVLSCETVFLWQLFRQHGRLLVRLDGLEQRLTGSGPFLAHAPVTQGLAVGASAPSFEAVDASGATVRLPDLLRGARAVLLIFSDSGCRPCALLLPEIKRWQQAYAKTIRIVLLSRRSDDANLGLAASYDLDDVLFQDGDTVAQAYQVHGTPAAVLVSAEGTIGTPVAMGGDAIAELLTSYGAGPSERTGVGKGNSDLALEMA